MPDFDTKEGYKMYIMKSINKSVLTQLYSDYQNAIKRILFLDFDGKLLSFKEYPELTTIDMHSMIENVNP